MELKIFIRKPPLPGTASFSLRLKLTFTHATQLIFDRFKTPKHFIFVADYYEKHSRWNFTERENFEISRRSSVQNKCAGCVVQLDAVSGLNTADIQY